MGATLGAHPPTASKPRRAFTYFFQSDQGGPIKIGVTGDVVRRLRMVQNGHPYRLRVVGLMEGNHEVELFRRFAAHRLCGEWFRPMFELREFIRSIRYSAPNVPGVRIPCEGEPASGPSAIGVYTGDPVWDEDEVARAGKAGAA